MNSLWFPCDHYYSVDLPDTDVQSGIENCIFSSLDHIYHRHRNMAYYCRIHSHKTRRATTAAGMSFDEMVKKFRGKEEE